MQHNQWIVVRDRLAKDIKSGRLRPGERLPTETQLCALFDVGRHSVRRAVTQLVLEHKLRVEQGSGTYVTDVDRVIYNISQRTRYSANMARSGRATGNSLIRTSKILAKADIAQALQLAKGKQVYRIHFYGTKIEDPLSTGSTYLPAARFPEIDKLYKEYRSLTQCYQHYGIEDYLRRNTLVYARRATPKETKALKQHPDHPVLVTYSVDIDLQGNPIGYAKRAWASTRVQLNFETSNQ